MRTRFRGKDLRTISRELRRMDRRVVLTQFRRELRSAAAPLVPAVRKSVMAIPVKGPKHTGLRQRIARAVTLQVRTTGKNAGVSIFVDSQRKMPDHEKSLPAYMEGVKPRWRHPTFGHDPWVQQEAHPYFYPVMRLLGPRSRIAVDRAVKQVTKQIT